MGLQITKLTPSGIDATYHKVVSVHPNFNKGRETCDATIEGFKDKAHADTGPQSLLSFSYHFEGSDALSFGGTAIENKKLVYDLVKKKDADDKYVYQDKDNPEFDGAIDVIE